MKKILLLFALIAYFNIPVLGQYTVKIRIGTIDSTKEGWQIHVSYADVFNDNGELIPHEDLPGGTSYVWEQDQCQLGQGFIPKVYIPILDCDGEVSEGGEPNPTITCDNSLNFGNYLFRVKVTINSTVFISDTVRFPDSGSGSLDQKIVNFDQRREEDNNSVGMIGKLRGNSFLHYVVPFTYCYPAAIQNDIYRASQSFRCTPFIGQISQ